MGSPKYEAEMLATRPKSLLEHLVARTETMWDFKFSRRLVWCSELSSDDGGSTHLWNVGRQLFYTAVYPRRQFWTTETMVVVTKSLLEQCERWYLMTHNVVTTTIEHMTIENSDFWHPCCLSRHSCICHSPGWSTDVKARVAWKRFWNFSVLKRVDFSSVFCICLLLPFSEDNS
jgi:hypothetical protein